MSLILILLVTGCETVPRYGSKVLFVSEPIPSGTEETPCLIRLTGPGGVRVISKVLDKDLRVSADSVLPVGKWTAESITAPQSDLPLYGKQDFVVGDGGDTKVDLKFSKRPPAWPMAPFHVRVEAPAGSGAVKAWVNVGRSGKPMRRILLDLSKDKGADLGNMVVGRYTVMVEFLDGMGVVIHVPEVQDVVLTGWQGVEMDFAMPPVSPPIKNIKLIPPAFNRSDVDPVKNIARIGWTQMKPFESEVSGFTLIIKDAETGVITEYGPFPPTTQSLNIPHDNSMRSTVTITVWDDRGQKADTHPKPIFHYVL